MPTVPGDMPQEKNPLFRRHLVDPWRDSFITQLRLAEVRGSAIGDALAQVDSHCAESGETPEQAFGDPAEYAAQVVTSLVPGSRDHFPWWQASLSGVGVILGLAGILEGLGGLAHQTPAHLTLGTLVAAAVAAATVPMMFALMPRAERSRQLWLWVLISTPFPLVVLVQVSLRAQIVGLPAGVAVGLGALILGVTWLPYLMDRRADDPIIDPITGKEPFRLPRWVWGLTWGIPVLMFLIAVAVTVLVPSST